MRFSNRLAARILAALGVSFFGQVALAAPAFAPPGRGQPGLVVGNDAKGVLRAKVCSTATCDLSDGLDLQVPADARANTARARLAVVGLGSGRRAVVASVPAAAGTQFEAVLAAPLNGTTPKLIFSGTTGLAEGNDGVRQGRVVNISEPDEDGARHILVGEAREDLDLCGRPALLAPLALNPDDLTLYPAKLQRLSEKERAAAKVVQAVRRPEAAPPAAAGVLRAIGASSAIGSPAALTDGRTDTTWSENRNGVGRGEFAVFTTPADLPLVAFDLVLSPPGSALDRGNVPKELWLVTQHEVFSLQFPDEAAREAGLVFRVSLPGAVSTDCVALVAESAFEERKNSRLGLAEVSVVSELTDHDPQALVGALSGGGERAKAAGALLRTLGEPAQVAIARRFESLDEGGKRVALEVLDSAPCDKSVPVYLDALAGPFFLQREHARDHLRRCGRASAEALAERLSKAKGNAALAYADELVIVAPDLATRTLTHKLVNTTARERRPLRVVLARAALQPAAHDTVSQLLGDQNLPARATLDLLRALGANASMIPEARPALARVLREPSFDMHYLSLGPASVLAGIEPEARAAIEHARTQIADPRLRVRALEVMPRDNSSTAGFLAALNDPEVRVREAGLHGIRDARVASALPQLTKLLEDDRWPLVRRAAAEALAQLPSEAKGNDALLEALSDPAPSVRREVSAALGARGVAAAIEPLRKQLTDQAEANDVRRESARALGQLCDRPSTDQLVRLASKLSDPLSSADERALGEAALEGLGTLAPADLQSRLGALLQNRGSSAAAQRALKRARIQPNCGAPGARATTSSAPDRHGSPRRAHR
ncbi:MAG TPA: HEAT repeat domain-containing protein [Polyangiaceae bacterium]|nr:HEAT repeat domain-containing protein [Polyangiaceae bacterium]